MAKKTFLFLSIVMLFLFPVTVWAQASRYPAVARLMAGDGFSKRQNGYVASISKESMEYNRLGFKAYQAKDYTLAIRNFDRALQADKSNMFARFNLACSLSLAYGSKADENTMKNIINNLVETAVLDVHWIYKIFTDNDLDPVRERLISYTIYFPCPGDCCPEEYFFLKPDGTAGYAAEYPDLSGMDDVTPPTIAAKGWYTIISDCFLMYIPGRNSVLAGFPAMDPMGFDMNSRRHYFTA